MAAKKASASSTVSEAAITEEPNVSNLKGGNPIEDASMQEDAVPARGPLRSPGVEYPHDNPPDTEVGYDEYPPVEDGYPPEVHAVNGNPLYVDTNTATAQQRLSRIYKVLMNTGIAPDLNAVNTEKLVKDAWNLYKPGVPYMGFEPALHTLTTNPEGHEQG